MQGSGSRSSPVPRSDGHQVSISSASAASLDPSRLEASWPRSRALQWLTFLCAPSGRACCWGTLSSSWGCFLVRSNLQVKPVNTLPLQILATLNCCWPNTPSPASLVAGSGPLPHFSQTHRALWRARPCSTWKGARRAFSQGSVVGGNLTCNGCPVGQGCSSQSHTLA